ncbi:MAG TPA: LamG domain-containing protein, partial [Sedimentisphaerales bacterium]|nr:LamG domain-containing protein [Sedimentisphaerales bacterium]
ADAVDLGIAGRSARTITSWVAVRSFNSGAVYEMGSTGDGEEFAFRARSSIGQWRAQYGGNVYHTITGFDTRGDWAHFAQVYTGGHSYVYVNGVLESSMAVRLDTGTDKDFRIGRWNNDYFDGLIDEVRIYDKALTEAEIAGVMAGGTAIADYHPVASPMNLTDPEAAGSRGVNFADFAVFMNEWAEEQLWP